MTKYSYRFSNLCGTVYKTGNLVYSSDGATLYSPVGNRVSVFALADHTARTLNFEARSDLDRIAITPDDRMLLAIDLGALRACVRAYACICFIDGLISSLFHVARGSHSLFVRSLMI